MDYSLITKYGVIVGKEKIEKNTPIFEASTNASYAVNFYLTNGNADGTVDNTTSNSSNNQLGAGTNASDTAQVTVSTSATNGETFGTIVNYDARFIVVKAPGMTNTQHVGNGRMEFLIESSSNASQLLEIKLVPDGAKEAQRTFGSLKGATKIKLTNTKNNQSVTEIFALDYTETL